MIGTPAKLLEFGKPNFIIKIAEVFVRNFLNLYDKIVVSNLQVEPRKIGFPCKREIDDIIIRPVGSCSKVGGHNLFLRPQKEGF